MAVNPDAVALQAYSKDQVDYRQHESCKTCSQFNGRSKCNQVQGNISPDAICSKWSLYESSPHMTGKEFIETEYDKSKGSV